MVKRLTLQLAIGMLILSIILALVIGGYSYLSRQRDYEHLGTQNALLGARITQHVIEKAIDNGLFDRNVLFGSQYRRIDCPGAPRYHTEYDYYFDRNVATILDAIEANEDIHYAYVVNRDGYVVVHNDSGLSKTMLAPVETAPQSADPQQPRPLVVRNAAGHDFYEFHATIAIEGRPWGEFRVGIPVALVRNRGRQLAARTLIVTLGFSFFVVVTMTWLIRRGLRPLEDVTRATRQMADGNVLSRCHYQGHDELGTLAKSFNMMAEKISRTQETLEEKVRQRTAELARTNGDLRAEVAERKRNQEALKLANFCIEQAAECILWVDHEGRVVYGNKKAAEVLEYSRDDLRRITVFDIDPTMSPDAWKPFWEASREHEGVFRETQHRTSSGKSIPVEISVNYMVCDGKEYHCAFARDISERRRAEQALRDNAAALEHANVLLKEANAAAEEASRAKSQFLAAMSHELRTPLNGVIGMAELLARTDLDERQRGFAEACRSSGKSLLALINDILDFSKIEAGKMELDEHEFDLDRVVEETVATLAFQARQKGIQLFGYVAPPFCRRVRGDSGRLRQVLVNLIGNAVKFTAVGEVVVRVDPVEAAGDPPLARFSVSDTGAGISAEAVDRLFQSFSQADASTTRKHGGTGLGLAISKSLVELMGGRIGVESQPGQGSTFWFTFPVRTVAGVEGRSASLSAELQRLRVLLLDDNTMTRQHLVDVFQAWSVTVDTAATETASIESLRHAAELRQPVDLLVVDDKTVRKEQLGDFIAEIRRMSGLRSCKKFYIANPENALSDTEGTRLGVDHCLTKPVCQSALLGAVNNYCIEAGSIHAPVAVPLRPLRASAGMFGKARVLLAEDNPINQQVAQEILRQAGVECRVVENGRQALEAVARERFDLILMDCQMPEMDGFIATQRIREMEASAELPGRVPVIALTANAIKGDRERCLAAGMDDYVSKPFEVDSLLATIGRFLSVPRKPANTGPGDAPKNLLPPLSGDPPIDRKVLLGHCSENLQFAHHLLSDFAKEMPRRFQRIAEFVGQGDAPAASEVAHSLKGAAGILAATAVQAASAEIEAAGKAGDIAKMMPLVEKLRDAIRRCQEFIPEIQTTLIITEEAQYAHATT